MSENGPTEQAAYEHELKRQDRELELKKQELVQKEHNDTLLFRVTVIGVIVALITVAVSYWAARDTSENSRKGLELQSKSIDAQIESMRNDQRPYASVTFAGMKQYPFPGEWADEGRLAPILLLTVRGHTPALHTTINMGCALIDAVNFHDVRNVPMTHDKVVAEYTPSTMFPDEKLSVPCSDPIKWFQKTSLVSSFEAKSGTATSPNRFTQPRSAIGITPLTTSWSIALTMNQPEVNEGPHQKTEEGSSRSM